MLKMVKGGTVNEQAMSFIDAIKGRHDNLHSDCQDYPLIVFALFQTSLCFNKENFTFVYLPILDLGKMEPYSTGPFPKQMEISWNDINSTKCEVVLHRSTISVKWVSLIQSLSRKPEKGLHKKGQAY